MKKSKLFIIALAVVSLTATQCKKKNTETGTAETKAAVELQGTPAQKMTQLMQMGVDALKNNTDPKAAAAKIQSLLTQYSVADLRAAAKSAKEAGNGATKEEIDAYKSAVDEYKKLAGEVGAKDPAAFNAAATAWAKAWSIN